ncbi:MAG: rod shape-determining protein MreD [Acidobacteriota bacterium]
MRIYLKVILVIFAAFIAHTLLGNISNKIFLMVNLFTIIVIYFSVLKGEIFGAVTGTVCGLIQDSFSLGIFGVAGIATTIMGYLAGFISKKIYVMSFFKIFLFIFTLTLFQLAVWRLIHSFIFSEPFLSGNSFILYQPFFNALVGSLFFPIFKKILRSRSTVSQ